MSERLKWLIVGTSASIIILVLNMTLSPTNKMSKHAVLPMTQAQNDSVAYGTYWNQRLVSAQNDTAELDTLFFPNEKIPFAWVMRADTFGNITICYPPAASPIGDSSASYDDQRNLKVKLVDGRWEVESALPVRIKLNDGYLESNGDSIEMGFSFVDTAQDFGELAQKVFAKKRRGESWFIGSPLNQGQADYLMRMIDKIPDTSYVKAYQ